MNCMLIENAYRGSAFGTNYKPYGRVDQLEDRYLGMVEAPSSNLGTSTFSTIGAMRIRPSLIQRLSPEPRPMLLLKRIARTYVKSKNSCGSILAMIAIFCSALQRWQ